MCTAISLKNYFGRNLDLEYSYNETITITPKNYKFKFCEKHYALVGMAYVKDNYPLYYDAINEKGLGAAALNFPENAAYNKFKHGKTNIASFEFIPFVLSQCSSISDVKDLLKNINITDDDFSDELPASSLHWMISDSCSSLVVECINGDLNVFDNTLGVLTNNPPFEMQLFNLNNYIRLSNKQPKNDFVNGLIPYSRGMGALGLPGDLSSQSRFVKAVFTKHYSVSAGDDISQFFHVLSSVEQQRGCVKVGDKYEITLYSACCDLKKGIYYYKTYSNSQITAINMHNESLDSSELINYPLITKENIFQQN